MLLVSTEDSKDAVKNRLTPFLNSVYSSGQEIGSEIGQVSSILVECGLQTLPLTNGRKSHRWKDEVLNNLCALSKNARKVWVKVGRPPSGPEFDEKCRLRREVWKRFCAGKAERLRIRRRDRMYCILKRLKKQAVDGPHQVLPSSNDSMNKCSICCMGCV